jgi:hypothetical protein
VDKEIAALLAARKALVKRFAYACALSYQTEMARCGARGTAAAGSGGGGGRGRRSAAA